VRGLGRESRLPDLPSFFSSFLQFSFFLIFVCCYFYFVFCFFTSFLPPKEPNTSKEIFVNLTFVSFRAGSDNFQMLFFSLNFVADFMFRLELKVPK